MNYLEIIKQIGDKDKRGLESLFEHYSDKLYGYSVDVWHMTEDDATDVIYKTLESVVLNIKSYEFASEKHFNNFIWKVFKNCLGMKYRQVKAQEKHISFIPFSEIYANIDEDDSGPEENKKSGSETENIEVETLPIINKQKLDEVLSEDDIYSSYNQNPSDNPKLLALKVALSKLKKLDRDLLLLKAQNYSYEQIAKMLKIENNQLKVRHLRAKRQLIKLLTETL